MVASKVTDMDQTRVSGAASDRDRMGVPVRTPRLLLRRPTMADAAFHHALHSDPALYEHSPSAREVDPTANAEVLRRWIEHWEREGFGYWIAERVPLGRAGSIAEPSIGPPVGFVGVRRDADVLNLYYRFSPPGSRPLATDGDPEESRGLGREAARAAVAWATQWLPDERVQAVCKQTNARAIATAHAAGLLPAGRQDAGDGSMFGRWVSPRFEVTSGGEVTSGAGGSTVAAFTDGEVDEMLDLWERVVRAEGSVGFRQDAPRPEISDRLRQQLDATLTGAQILVRMRDPADRLLGFAWWVRGPRTGSPTSSNCRASWSTPRSTGAISGRSCWPGCTPSRAPNRTFGCCTPNTGSAPGWGASTPRTDTSRSGGIRGSFSPRRASSSIRSRCCVAAMVSRCRVGRSRSGAISDAVCGHRRRTGACEVRCAVAASPQACSRPRPSSTAESRVPVCGVAYRLRWVGARP